MLGHQAGVDAHSVAKLRAAGALILGKANQDEFAFFTTGFSNRAIQVSNPYNTSESPAGSSSALAHQLRPTSLWAALVAIPVSRFAILLRLMAWWVFAPVWVLYRSTVSSH